MTMRTAHPSTERADDVATIREALSRVWVTAHMLESHGDSSPSTCSYAGDFRTMYEALDRLQSEKPPPKERLRGRMTDGKQARDNRG